MFVHRWKRWCTLIRWIRFLLLFYWCCFLPWCSTTLSVSIYDVHRIVSWSVLRACFSHNSPSRRASVKDGRYFRLNFLTRLLHGKLRLNSSQTVSKLQRRKLVISVCVFCPVSGQTKLLGGQFRTKVVRVKENVCFFLSETVTMTHPCWNSNIKVFWWWKKMILSLKSCKVLTIKPLIHA